jgi:hypothetical protein
MLIIINENPLAANCLAHSKPLPSVPPVTTGYKLSPLGHSTSKPKNLPKKQVHKPLNKLNNNLQIKINIKIIAIISKYKN